MEHQHRSSWVEFKFSNVQVLCLAGGTAAAAGLLWCALKKPPLFGTCVLRETLALMLPGTYSMMMERRRNSFFWEGSGRMALSCQICWTSWDRSKAMANGDDFPKGMFYQVCRMRNGGVLI